MWRRLKQVLIAIDQLLNTLLGGYADETAVKSGVSLVFKRYQLAENSH